MNSFTKSYSYWTFTKLNKFIKSYWILYWILAFVLPDRFMGPSILPLAVRLELCGLSRVRYAPRLVLPAICLEPCAFIFAYCVPSSLCVCNFALCVSLFSTSLVAYALCLIPCTLRLARYSSYLILSVLCATTLASWAKILGSTLFLLCTRLAFLQLARFFKIAVQKV